MKEVMGVGAVAVELDQHFPANRNVRDTQLSAEQFYDRLGICDRDIVMLDEPVRDRAVVAGGSQLCIQFRPQLPNRARQPGRQRHLRRIPAWHGREMPVGALDVRFLHAGINQPDDPAAENKQIADAQLLDEIFFNGSEAAMAQEDVNETFGMDGPDVDEKLAGEFRISQRDETVLDPDLAEYGGVLFRQRFAAAFQILKDPVELGPAKIPERIGTTHERKCLLSRNRRDRSQSYDVLSDDVVRF